MRSLLAAMKVKGDGVVVHGLRGRPSNRRIDEKIRERAMGIVKSPDWHDFRPTFASEQLAKQHQIQVSKETVRKWMMAEGSGRVGDASCGRCTSGDRGGAITESWCNGTLPTTTGWKDEASRCTIGCG